MMDASVHAVAGGSAAVMAMALLYPLENIRCRLQVQVNREDTDRYVSNDSDRETRLEGVVDALIKVPQREGIRGLYRGLTSALAGVFIGSATYFYFYSFLKKRALRNGSHLSPSWNIIIASIAGIINALVTNPIWVIQTRLAVDTRDSSSIIDALLGLFKREGISGLYAGLWPSLILVSNPAIQFVMYDQLARRVAISRGKQQLSNSETFVIGAFAKSIATVITYPYQLVKSRMQVAKSPRSLARGYAKYQGIWDAFIKIFMREGLSGLYGGLSAKMGQTVLNAAFLFLFYERILSQFIWLKLFLAKK